MCVKRLDVRVPSSVWLIGPSGIATSGRTLPNVSEASALPSVLCVLSSQVSVGIICLLTLDSVEAHLKCKQIAVIIK